MPYAEQMGSSAPIWIVADPQIVDEITDYDRQTFHVYAALLDLDDVGESWQHAARDVLQIDPDAEPTRAERMHRAHLERARWMVRVGWPRLLNDWKRKQRR